MVAELDAAGLRPPLLHAANSAAALAHPAARYDLVRCGIAVYGIAPVARARRLGRPPARRCRSTARVSFVKRVAAGERLSYGLRYRCERDSVDRHGADRLRRRRAAAGCRRSAARCSSAAVADRSPGTVTMDQILVDCGDDRRSASGDEVVLIGAPGRRADHRRGLGRAARHDRLRDRVRHRAEGAAALRSAGP